MVDMTSSHAGGLDDQSFIKVEQQQIPQDKYAELKNIRSLVAGIKDDENEQNMFSKKKSSFQD